MTLPLETYDITTWHYHQTYDIITTDQGPDCQRSEITQNKMTRNILQRWTEKEKETKAEEDGQRQSQMEC